MQFRKVHKDGKVYICHTCHDHLNKKQIPPQAQANNMELDPIPPELHDLNELEVRLIAQRNLFMQIRELPAGGQKGLRGPAVSVPTDLGPACPRVPQNTHVIPLKFKRKLEYRSVYLRHNQCSESHGCSDVFVGT